MALSGRDLKQDVLFRAGESLSASGWDDKVLEYLNRGYKALSMGASEFLPEYVDDWWWMRDQASLILDPMYNTGTVAVVQGSVSITFSVAPAASLSNWHFRIEGHPDVFKISSHTAASTAATLDTVYTGESNAVAAFKALRTIYTLSASVAVILSPMISYREVDQILGVTPERMDQLFPLSRLSSGVPTAFCIEDPMTVRFSHGGRTDGLSMRVDYRFKPVVTELTDSTSSFPLLPDQYRHILSDIALTYLMIDKNDDRAAASSGSARSGLLAMFRENRRRLPKMDQAYGHIHPRQGQVRQRGPLRTESGLIIG